MNDIVPSNFGALSTRFVNQQVEDDLSAGVQSSYGIVGYRGKVWRLKYRGDETDLMRDDGDGPRASIEVVLLRAATHLSKIFYKNGYIEGSTEAPDCFSNNGVTPDMGAKERQAATCAACPRNAWGSRITPAGKQGKECSDSKRVVVAPLGDLNNEAYGGPMLLRVPAASLQDLAQFGQKLGQLGYPYYAVGARISFDTKEAFPKLLFSAIRPLTDPEAELVIQLRDDARTARVLGDSEVPSAVTPAVPSPQSVFEQPPAPAAVQQAAPVVAPTPVVAPAPVAGFGAPAVQPPAAAETPAATRRRNYNKQQAAAPTPAPAAVQPAAPAPVAQPTGFGSGTVAQPEVQAQPQAAVPETAPTGVAGFDDALEAQLDKLLG
jgi:hypothetical protein